MTNVTMLRKENVKIGEDIKIEYISTKDLTSGVEYQRPLNKQRIQSIVSNFDEHKFGVIKVSSRDDKYYVYDGQHRLVIIKAVNQGRDVLVPCEIHYGLTYKDEARLFAEQYEGTKKVDAIYQHKARFEAGDIEIIKLKEIAEEAGFVLDFTTGKYKNKIIATSKLLKVFKDLGELDFTRYMNIIRETWNGEMNSIDQKMLGGVWLFYKTYKSKFNEETFIKNLGKVDPGVILRKGNSDLSTKKIDLRFARVILECYNKCLRGSKLEYKYKG